MASQEVRFYSIGASSPTMTFTSNPSAPAPWYKLIQIRGWHNHNFSGVFHEYSYSTGGIGPKASHRGMKQMAIEGVIYGGTDAAATTAWGLLGALFRDGSAMRMEVTDTDGLSYWMNVYAADSIQMEPIRSNAMRVLIPVIAPDPRKYSTTTQQLTQNVSGTYGNNEISASFTNVGTAPALVRALLINGTIPLNRYPFQLAIVGGDSFTWGNSSGTFQSVEFLPDHGGVAIDPNGQTPADGQLTLNNNKWPEIPAGSTRTISLQFSGPSSVSSGAQFIARVWSTWW